MKEREEKIRIRGEYRSVHQDRCLASEIRKHPCLYNRKDKNYKQKVSIDEAWRQIELALGYEEGKPGS